MILSFLCHVFWSTGKGHGWAHSLGTLANELRARISTCKLAPISPIYSWNLLDAAEGLTWKQSPEYTRIVQCEWLWMLIGQDHKNCVKHQKISEISSDSSPADRPFPPDWDGYEKNGRFLLNFAATPRPTRRASSLVKKRRRVRSETHQSVAPHGFICFHRSTTKEMSDICEDSTCHMSTRAGHSLWRRAYRPRFPLATALLLMRVAWCSKTQPLCPTLGLNPTLKSVTTSFSVFLGGLDPTANGIIHTSPDGFLINLWCLCTIYNLIMPTLDS